MDLLFVSEESKLFGLTIFISIVGFQMCYVFVQWLLNKRVDHLYYIAYMFTTILYGISLYKAQLDFYPFSLIDEKIFFSVSITLPPFSIFLYYSFSRSFLSLQKVRPELCKWVKKLEMFLLTYVFLSMVLSIMNYDNEVRFLLFKSMAVLTIIASAFIIKEFLRKSIPLERFAMLGASLILVGSVFDILLYELEANYNIFYCDRHLPLLICVIAELLTYTTGLGYKTRLIEKQKSDYERSLLKEIAKRQKIEISFLQFRDNISRELHDDLGSQLSAAQNLLYHFNKFESHKSDNKTIATVLKILHDTVVKFRYILSDMQQNTLVENGYIAAVEELVNKIIPVNTISFALNHHGMEERLSKQTEHHLFRITQELINNTIKYASANKITIDITRDRDRVVFMYADDGIGFDMGSIRNGNGLENIKQRTVLLKGEIEINSQKMKGTDVNIYLTLE